MKPLLPIMFVFATTFLFAQHTTEQDVFNAREVTFYGYDFSNFKLADGKRMDEDIKKFTVIWSAFGQENISEKRMAKWLNKETVNYDFDPTLAVNRKLSSDDLGTITKHTLPSDSIQTMVNRYNLRQKQGIGFVVILECFDNSSKRVSGYYTFFDIATKKVLMSEYLSSRDGNSYNRVSDWGTALVIAVGRFGDAYSAKAK